MNCWWTKVDSFLLLKIQCSQNSNGPVICLQRSPLLLCIPKPLLFMCPKYICHNLVMLESDEDDDETTIEPVIIAPYKNTSYQTCKLNSHLSHFLAFSQLPVLLNHTLPWTKMASILSCHILNLTFLSNFLTNVFVIVIVTT